MAQAPEVLNGLGPDPHIGDVVDLKALGALTELAPLLTPQHALTTEPPRRTPEIQVISVKPVGLTERHIQKLVPPIRWWISALVVMLKPLLPRSVFFGHTTSVFP